MQSQSEMPAAALALHAPASVLANASQPGTKAAASTPLTRALTACACANEFVVISTSVPATVEKHVKTEQCLTLPPKHMAAAVSPTRQGVLGITLHTRAAGPAASSSWATAATTHNDKMRATGLVTAPAHVVGRWPPHMLPQVDCTA